MTALRHQNRFFRRPFVEPCENHDQVGAVFLNALAGAALPVGAISIAQSSSASSPQIVSASHDFGSSGSGLDHASRTEYSVTPPLLNTGPRFQKPPPRTLRMPSSPRA
jgi:hypothetical protein